MRVAIDISPLKDNAKLAHRVRGVGFYIENLLTSLQSVYTRDIFTSFILPSEIPQETEVVHFPYFEPFFVTLPLRKKYKTVVTVHDLTPLVFPSFFPPGIKGNIRWNVQKRLLSGADHIITDSISSKRDIERIVGVPSSKISVVYLAASEEFTHSVSEERRKEIKDKYGLPEKFVLYVGDVTWNKNLPRLVKAFEGTDIPLVMVGKALTQENYDKNNPWNQDLVTVQELIKKNSHVTALGFVATEDLVVIYNLAMVFVMPSLYEGFGLPILEAMKCSCPVVTSNRGSLREVAGESAYFIDPEDTENIKQGIEYVFNDAAVQKSLAQKGNEHVKQFSWKRTAEGTMAVYRHTQKV